jgi:hypothetical protein
MQEEEREITIRPEWVNSRDRCQVMGSNPLRLNAWPSFVFTQHGLVI